MKEFLTTIKEYADTLSDCAVWHNSKEILAPIFNDSNSALANDCYIYEFFCYISIVVDLKNNYEIRFKRGNGVYEYKFPQAAANKSGKPLFLAFKDQKAKFQICAGTKIDGVIDSEENHPDISFQLPLATDTPTFEDLILIMDAKYKENEDVLPKSEVYKFGMIIDLFELRGPLKQEVLFHDYKGFESNCLITNGKAYSEKSNTKLLEKYSIKEVENFFPNKSFLIIG